MSSGLDRVLQSRDFEATDSRSRERVGPPPRAPETNKRLRMHRAHVASLSSPAAGIDSLQSCLDQGGTGRALDYFQ